jgi:hypothetical protein
VDWQPTPDGFRVHLRHHWNTPNWFMRAAGWPGKANEFHVDELLLDRVFTYHRASAVCVCELTITNLSRESKCITPWLHLAFTPWHADRWVVIGDQRQDHQDTEIYWGHARGLMVLSFLDKPPFYSDSRFLPLRTRLLAFTSPPTAPQPRTSCCTPTGN